MSSFIYFSHDCPVKIWGLTSAERIEKVLKGTGIRRISGDLSTLQESDTVLILRGDYLFDDRLVKYLASEPNIALQLEEEQDEKVVAAHVSSQFALQALAVIEGKEPADTLTDIQLQFRDTIAISFENVLRKFEPPFVLPITAEKKRGLERRLFDWSYKGITDLVTKWAWPRPARFVVGYCVRFKIRPNHVTLVGLFLTIAAVILFAKGQYGLGLLAGWMMTFLDTVDGKLARVTVTSSKFGHYFDHIIDLVHPPIWYIYWGLGLTAVQLSSLSLP